MPNGDHCREFGRVDRAVGCSGTASRLLAAYRDQAIRETLAADAVSAPGLLRRDADVNRQGYRERPCNGRHVALGIRADQPTTAPMAEMGPVLRDERDGR